jgi:hypothetical protein
MNYRVYNLFMLFFWLVIGIMLIFREQFLPETYQTADWDTRLKLMTLVAFAFVIWNSLRWWSYRRSQIEQVQREKGSRSRIEALGSKDPPEIVNPEFDFSQTDPSTNPTRNGK